jgi:cellulose synthase/poly-beta-1,6-N-acetylglucosamine synthase-like glycosyltransferase
VALVTAARNEAACIAEKIANCRQQDYPQDRLEVVIASDGSEDATADTVRRVGGANVRLVELRPHRGKAVAVNRAVAATQAEILVFSDANSMFRPDAVSQLVRHFSDPDVGGVSGLLRPVNRTGDASGEGEGLYWRYESWLKRLESDAGALIGANGAIHAMRRECYTVIPEGLINDDFFLSMKVLEQGKRVILEPSAVAVEETAPSLAAEFTRHVRDAAGHFQVLPHVTRMLGPSSGFVAFGLWSHRVLRWILPFILPVGALASLSFGPTSLHFLPGLGTALLCLLAAGGWLLWRLGKPAGPLYVPLYFVAVNLAVVVGFGRFARGRIVWERVRP